MNKSSTPEEKNKQEMKKTLSSTSTNKSLTQKEKKGREEETLSPSTTNKSSKPAHIWTVREENIIPLHYQQIINHRIKNINQEKKKTSSQTTTKESSTLEDQK